MLKKKTLTETIYNNGDPYPIRKALDAVIGGWQKQDKYDILWETLQINTYDEENLTYMKAPQPIFVISVEAVYSASE